MLDWPMSSPQMMTMLGFLSWANAAGESSGARERGATTNGGINLSARQKANISRFLDLVILLALLIRWVA